MLGDLIKFFQAILGWHSKREELQRKYQLDDAIDVQIETLFKDARWERRSFKAIRKAIGGYDKDQDELRRHLVRVGATRSGQIGDDEYWALAATVRGHATQNSQRRYGLKWSTAGAIAAMIVVVVTVLQIFDVGGIDLPEQREIVYKLMASSNCPPLGFEQTERPRICRTAANGEEIAERTSVVFHYNPSYEEGLARNKVAGDIGVIKPLYNGFCLPKARLLDLYVSFGKDVTVWSVSTAEITSVHNYRMPTNMGFVPDPLIPKGRNDPMAAIYPADRYGGAFNQFQANPWGLWLTCTVEIVRKRFVEAAHTDCGLDVMTNFDRPVYQECRHPAHGIELGE